MNLLTLLSNNFWDDVVSIRTPLALAGLFAAILFLIARQVIKSFRPKDPSHRHAFVLANRILNFLFVLSLVAMLLGFFAYRFPPRYTPSPDQALTAAESEALRLEDQVMILRGSWENADNSAADKRKVSEEGPKLGKQFLAINDVDLGPQYRVLKYEYAMYAFTMSASADSRRDSKLAYASKALNLAGKAGSEVNDIRQKYTTSNDYMIAMKFVSEDETEDRLNYLSAICLCRKAEILNDSALKQQASQAIARVSPAHLGNYPIRGNTEFTGCLDDKGDVK
jgi:hypothetical protein